MSLMTDKQASHRGDPWWRVDKGGTSVKARNRRKQKKENRKEKRKSIVCTFPYYYQLEAYEKLLYTHLCLTRGGEPRLIENSWS